MDAYRHVYTLCFAVFDVLPCVMHTHVFVGIDTGLLYPWYVVMVPM